jgi:hypothetical protein
MPGSPPLFPRPRFAIVRRAMNEGVFGDNRFWKAIGFAIIGRRIFRHIMQSEPRLVAVEKLKPGQTIVLRGVTSRHR